MGLGLAASAKLCRRGVVFVLSRSWRWWPILHWPLLLLAVAICLWRHERGYWLVEPDPMSMIGGTPQLVESWTYFSWQRHPVNGPKRPYYWRGLHFQLLTGQDVKVVTGPPIDWQAPPTLARFAQRLATLGLISDANEGFALAKEEYSNIVALMRQRPIPQDLDWGGGLVLQYLTRQSERRVTTVWFEHLPEDGEFLPILTTTWTGNDVRTLLSHRRWIIQFANFSEAESILHWWLYLLVLLCPPVLVGRLIHWGLKRRQRRKRIERGECPNCGYSLVGLPGALCPECGRGGAASTESGINVQSG